VVAGGARSRLRTHLPTALLVALTLGLLGTWTVEAASRLASPQPRGDFRHFYNAAQAMASGGELYTPHEEAYVYPPLFAFLLLPLGRLEYRTAGTIFFALNVALTLAALVLTIREACRRWQILLDARLLAGATCLTLLVLSEQCRWELALGQSDTWTLLGVVCGLLLLDRWPIAAGAALGFAANIKYQTLLFLPYLLVRGRLRASAGLVAGALLFAMIPATVRGWERNAQDLGTALAGVTGGAAERIHVNDVRWYLSVSLTSALARAVAPEGGGGGRILLAAGAAAGLVLVGVVLVYRRAGVRFLGRTQGDGVVLAEWMAVVAAFLLFGTSVTKRHLFLLLPLMASAVLLLLRPAPGAGRRPLLIGLLAFTLAVRLPPNVRVGEGAARFWKEIGGPSWGVFVLFFVFLWTALRRESPRKT